MTLTLRALFHLRSRRTACPAWPFCHALFHYLYLRSAFALRYRLLPAAAC